MSDEGMLYSAEYDECSDDECSDDECLDDECSDDDGGSDTEVELENQYYSGKNTKVENLTTAITIFEKVLDLEGNSRTKWGFKALKQIVKINLKLEVYQGVWSNYEKMLKYYVDSVVDKNEFEKSVYSILNLVASSNNIEVLQTIRELTLKTLTDLSHDRLWFNINMKLAKILWERKAFEKVFEIVTEMERSCKDDSDGDDVVILARQPRLLEIYIFKLEVYTEQCNVKKMKKAFANVMTLANIKPRISNLCTVYECVGKLQLLTRQHKRAYPSFVAAFLIHDDNGNPRRITCLKYLMLSSMLMSAVINPLSSGEAQRCFAHPETVAMHELVKAYNNDKTRFDAMLDEDHGQLLEDPFVRDQVQNLLGMIRTQTLIEILVPYTQIGLPCVASQMNVTVEEVEALLTTKVVNDIVQAKIDQVDLLAIIPKSSIREVSNRKQSRKLADSLFTTIRNIMKTLK